MSSPAMPGGGKPVPTLLSSGTARGIRDALIDAERAEFERRFAEEMASAAQTLDLTGVLQVLSTFRKIAEVTQRQGAAAHRRMLDQVARLQRGDDVPTVPGHVHKAEINARLGLLTVYSYDAVPDAVAQVDELPVPALSAYAELIAFLELTPWEGAPYRDDKPDGNMRTMPFGKRAEGMAVYVILEEQLRVVVVSVTWLELELADETCGVRLLDWTWLGGLGSSLSDHFGRLPVGTLPA